MEAVIAKPYEKSTEINHEFSSSLCNKNARQGMEYWLILQHELRRVSRAHGLHIMHTHLTPPAYHKRAFTYSSVGKPAMNVGDHAFDSIDSVRG